MVSSRSSYYRIILGHKNIHANECREGHFIGGDWPGMNFDLSGTLPEDWRDFNKMYTPIFLEKNPGRSKIAAGLACGMLHTICKDIKVGDFVLCPTGTGSYWAGEIIGDYLYVPGAILPHRRPVRWHPKILERSEFSQALSNSMGSGGVVSNITKHGMEIEKLLTDHVVPTLFSTDELVEDPAVFALEKHLEDFLVQNWQQTELGQNYDIVEDEGERVGQQYRTDTGNIDILAISKDKTEYLVVELKKGRASDAVVGQIQRYMGYIMDDIAEADQKVRGAIIALDDDLRLRRALQVNSSIDFYRYRVQFKLFKSPLQA